MSEKIEVVNRNKFFYGMPKEDKEVFDRILPFEDNVPKSEVIRKMNELPKADREIIEQICKRQYERLKSEVIECDRILYKKWAFAEIKKVAAAFLKTPIAKLLYAVILGLLLMQFIK